MLLSELEERERRFRLALRAGIPIFVFISLIFYTFVVRHTPLVFNTETTALLVALVFVTVYFIYFLMELAAEETIVDHTTQGFTQKSFIKRLNKFQPKTLVLLVIDNLSTLNENYSSEQVDSALYNLVHRLNDYLTQEGFHNILIARRYGAEFLIAFDSDDTRIETVLHTFCRNYGTVDDLEIDLRFALINNMTNDIRQDLKYLKDLLYIQTKQHKSSSYDIDLKDAQKVASVEDAIIQAIQNDTLDLTFRPIKNVKNEHIDIYEVSVKLRDAALNTIPPKVFLPIINRLGLGNQYDMVLFKHIVKLLPLVDDDVSFTFNLSPFSLRNKKFQEELFNTLQASNANPRRLIIELYERKAHHDLSGYLQTLERFRAQGIRIAIDNFGASNASMEYMKHFRFDFIQFDRDYVTNLGDLSSKAMLGSMIQMAKELDIKTIAKWVDKTEQRRELVAMGIDYLQGFGIAKPIDETELIKHYNP